MGTIFKKTITRPLPANAKIIVRKGVRYAQWSTQDGKYRTAELTTNGNRIKTESTTYIAKYRDGDGIVQEVSTGCTDKVAAQAVLNELVRIAQHVKCKIISSDQAKIAEHADTPLTCHIDDYLDYLKQRKVNADRLKTTKTRLQESAGACGWRYLRDLSSDKLESWLNEQVDLGVLQQFTTGMRNYGWPLGFGALANVWQERNRITTAKSDYLSILSMVCAGSTPKPTADVRQGHCLPMNSLDYSMQQESVHFKTQ